MLESGISIGKVAKAVHLSPTTVQVIKKTNSYSLTEIDNVKKRLPFKAYRIADEALDFITPEKLKDSSASALMTISAIGIDKARLLEGLPTENVSIGHLAVSIRDQLSEGKNIRDKIIDLIKSKQGHYEAPPTLGEQP